MNILVVEDEKLLAHLLKESLEEEGHAVSEPAMTASEGIRRSAALRPDLALIDIGLATGTGVEVANELWDRLCVPTIFISAGMPYSYGVGGAIGYIAKPCHLRTVLESVEVADELLRGKPLSRSIPQGFNLFVPHGRSAQVRPRLGTSGQAAEDDEWPAVYRGTGRTPDRLPAAPA